MCCVCTSETDSLGYVNIEHDIDTDDYEWGKVKREWLPPNPGQVCDVSKLARSTQFEHTGKA